MSENETRQYLSFGLGKRNEEFIIILNPDNIVSSDDMNILNSTVTE